MGSWEELVTTIVGPIDEIKKAVSAFPIIYEDKTEQETTVFDALCNSIWIGQSALPFEMDSLISKGIYSPVQLLLYLCGEKTKDSIKLDYPFCFSTIACFLDVLTHQKKKSKGEDAISAFEQYRTLLQSIFQLRERTEERESMSIEVELPLESNNQNGVEFKKLAQIFGRGIGVTTDEHLAVVDAPRGCINEIFRNHDTAPISSIYTLETSYCSVREDKVNIVLRRDGHVAIAIKRNPLLEFYNGGWHVSDLVFAYNTLDLMIKKSFEKILPGDLPKYLMNLAYHMGTHWHGGIIAVVDNDKLNPSVGILEIQDDNAKKISNEIKKCLEKETAEKTGTPSHNILDCKNAGLGRLLLSAAIQDGILLIGPDGEFLDSGRIAAKPSQSNEGNEICRGVKGGARTYAACKMSEHGVAIKISQDGEIMIFANKSSDLRISGLRVH